MLQTIARLRVHLRDVVEPPVLVSDRRLAKAVRVLRLAAYAAGGTEVCELDLLLLQHILWDKDPAQAEAVREWLFEHSFGAASPQQGGDDFLPQARFLLKAIKERLARASKPETASAALQDLANLRVPVEKVVCRRLEEQVALRALLSTEGGGGFAGRRGFWLEAADLEEASSRLLPRAAGAVADAEGVLREVLELEGALSLPDPEERDSCLRHLLGGKDGKNMQREQNQKLTGMFDQDDFP